MYFPTLKTTLVYVWEYFENEVILVYCITIGWFHLPNNIFIIVIHMCKIRHEYPEVERFSSNYAAIHKQLFRTYIPISLSGTINV